ncbi:hypothetical protein V8C26DRAFT_395240 [Trichoderma gracile]
MSLSGMRSLRILGGMECRCASGGRDAVFMLGLVGSRECVRVSTLAMIGLCSKALRHPNKCPVAVTYRRSCTCTGRGWLWSPSPRALRTPTEAPAVRRAASPRGEQCVMPRNLLVPVLLCTYSSYLSGC